MFGGKGKSWTLCLSSGCYDRIPWTGWLINNRFVSQSSGGWESAVKGPAWSGSGKGPLLCCRLLTSSVSTWQGAESYRVSFGRALIPSNWAPFTWPVYPSKPYLQIPSQQGLGFNLSLGRGHKHSVSGILTVAQEKKDLTQAWRDAGELGYIRAPSSLCCTLGGWPELRRAIPWCPRKTGPKTQGVPAWPVLPVPHMRYRRSRSTFWSLHAFWGSGFWGRISDQSRPMMMTTDDLRGLFDVCSESCSGTFY